MATGTEPVVEVVDLAQTSLRDLNARLHAAADGPDAPRRWRVSNPGGRHAIAVLPGAEQANVWEPAPATLYVWERALV